MPREHLALPGGARVRVRLRQESGTPHQTIGRASAVDLAVGRGREDRRTLPVSVQEALAAGDRTPAQRRLLQEEYRRATPSLAACALIGSPNLRRRLNELTRRRRLSWPSCRSRVSTHVMAGGNYRSSGKPVTPGVPKALHPMTDERAVESARPGALAGRPPQPTGRSGNRESASGRRYSDAAWSRRRRTSAPAPLIRRTPSCSTGWQSNSWSEAGASRPCCGRS